MFVNFDQREVTALAFQSFICVVEKSRWIEGHNIYYYSCTLWFFLKKTIIFVYKIYLLKREQIFLYNIFCSILWHFWRPCYGLLNILICIYTFFHSLSLYICFFRSVLLVLSRRRMHGCTTSRRRARTYTLYTYIYFKK